MNILRPLIALIAVLVLSFLPSNAQLTFVPEWKLVGKGSFVASHCYNNLAATDKQYLAVVSSDAGYGNADANVVKLSDDSGASWRNVRSEMGFNIDSVQLGKFLPGYWLKRFYSSVARPTKDLILVLASESWKDEKNPNADSYYGTLYPYILRSTDEGKSWERIEIQTPAVTCDRNILAMADASVGYLTSGVPVGSPGYAQLYKTTDGGKTWKPQQTPFDGGDILEMQALTATQLIVSTQHTVYFTSDGGATWTARAAMKDMQHYFFTDFKTGYCTGGSSNGVGDQYRTVAYKTTDSAKTWIRIMDTLGRGVSAGDVITFYNDRYGLLFARDDYWMTRDGGTTWSLYPWPYGSGYRATPSKALAMIDTNRFFGMTGNNMFFATGNNLLAPPVLAFEKQSTLYYTLRWNSIVGAKRYRVQVGKEVPEFKINYINYDIFDTPKKFLDTILTATELALPECTYGMYYFARIMAISDTLRGEWSAPALAIIPDKPKLPYLNQPTPIAPVKDSVLPSTRVTFHWKKDDRATHYRVRITTIGNFPQAFDDAPAHNFHHITADSLTADLLPNTTYYWFVIASAPDYDSTGSLSASFKTGATSAVDESDVQAAPEQHLLLSPQPVNDILQIHGDFLPTDIVEIYSVLGNKISEYPYSAYYDISSLLSGCYILHIGTKSALFTKL
ncbi:MAG: hypothetical protein U0264_08460 [Candidatus Kapaibacterium sp.]